jgi:hypothetical protein
MGKDDKKQSVAFQAGNKLHFPSMCPGSPGVRVCKSAQTQEICFTLCVMSTASWYCRQALDSFDGVLQAAMNGQPFPDLFYSAPRKPNGDASSDYCVDVRKIFKFLGSDSANPVGGMYHGGSRADPQFKEAPFYRCFIMWRLVEEVKNYMSFGQWRVFDYDQHRGGLWLRSVNRPQQAQLANNLQLIAQAAMQVAQFRGTDPTARTMQILSPMGRAMANPSNASAPSRIETAAYPSAPVPRIGGPGASTTIRPITIPARGGLNQLAAAAGLLVDDEEVDRAMEQFTIQDSAEEAANAPPPQPVVREREEGEIFSDDEDVEDGPKEQELAGPRVETGEPLLQAPAKGKERARPATPDADDVEDSSDDEEDRLLTERESYKKMVAKPPTKKARSA